MQKTVSIGYTPKKGKAVFASHKTSFVKNNDRFYTSCKQVGHIEQKCMKKRPQANVSSIKLDSFYVLTKGANGVKAKFIGAPWMGSKKKAIWVPKSFSLQRGLGYTPKKGKAAFDPYKTSFVKNNSRFYTSCKQVGHKREWLQKQEQEC